MRGAKHHTYPMLGEPEAAHTARSRVCSMCENKGCFLHSCGLERSARPTSGRLHTKVRAREHARTRDLCHALHRHARTSHPPARTLNGASLRRACSREGHPRTLHAGERSTLLRGVRESGGIRSSAILQHPPDTVIVELTAIARYCAHRCARPVGINFPDRSEWSPSTSFSTACSRLSAHFFNLLVGPTSTPRCALIAHLELER